MAHPGNFTTPLLLRIILTQHLRVISISSNTAPYISRSFFATFLTSTSLSLHVSYYIYIYIYRMKTYQLGTAGDRIVTVKKSQGQLVVTVKVKDAKNKFINLPPKIIVSCPLVNVPGWNRGSICALPNAKTPNQNLNQTLPNFRLTPHSGKLWKTWETGSIFA